MHDCYSDTSNLLTYQWNFPLQEVYNVVYKYRVAKTGNPNVQLLCGNFYESDNYTADFQERFKIALFCYACVHC